MLDQAIIETSIAHYHSTFGDSLSAPQSELIEKIILLAAKDNIALNLQENGIQDNISHIILNTVSRLPQSTISEEELQRTAEQAWQQINAILIEATKRARPIHENDAHQFEGDQIPLHEQQNREALWLTNKYVGNLMPKDTKEFIVLAPIKKDDLKSIDIQPYLENPEVQSIVLPVGPGHWRLVHIAKELSDSKPIKLTVSIFDSFGKQSASGINSDISQWLKSKTELPFNIIYDAPKNTQKDGYSCGDFVIAKAHQLAQSADVPNEPAFVNALTNGDKLRPLMIEKSQDPTLMLGAKPAGKWEKFKSKWNSTIESGQKMAEVLINKKNSSHESEEKTGERIIAYQVDADHEVQVDEKTQIKLDEMLARKLQDEECPEEPRKGPTR